MQFTDPRSVRVQRTCAATPSRTASVSLWIAVTGCGSLRLKPLARGSAVSRRLILPVLALSAILCAACGYERPTAPGGLELEFDLSAAVGFWWGDGTGLFRDSVEWTLDVAVANEDSVVATLVQIAGPGQRYARSDTTVFEIRATQISTESPRNAQGEFCRLDPGGGRTCDQDGITLIHLDLWAPVGRIHAFPQSALVKREIWFTDSLDDLDRCPLVVSAPSELERCRS